MHFLRDIANRGIDPPTTQWKYSAKTATSALRTHIMRYHGEEYYDRCTKLGIPIRIKDLQTGADSQVRMAADEDTDDDREPKFTEAKFLSYLISWIVHDDQVRDYEYIWRGKQPIGLTLSKYNSPSMLSRTCTSVDYFSSCAMSWKMKISLTVQRSAQRLLVCGRIASKNYQIL